MNILPIENKPLILNNNDFQTIQVKVIFPYEKNENDIALSNILPSVINGVNNTYRTEEEFSLQFEKLYLLGMYLNRTIIGTTYAYVYSLIIPDTYSLNKDILEEQFKFFGDFIYNPKKDNNKFCEFEVNREINNLKLEISDFYKNNILYHSIKNKQIVDDEGILSSTLFNHTEQVNNINTSNLYQLYLDSIYNNKPAIFVMGNVDNNKINKLCDKYLYRNKFNSYRYETNIRHYLKPKDNIREITEKSNFNNSIIAYNYIVKNMTEKDEIYLSIIGKLLSSSSSRILYKKLRDENDLVYNTSAEVCSKFGLLTIYAAINHKNLNQVKEKIIESIDELKNIDIINKGLVNIKEKERVGLLRLLDNKNSLFYDYIKDKLNIDYNSHEYYELICNINSNDIVKFVDRLVLDSIYYLKEKDYE